MNTKSRTQKPEAATDAPKLAAYPQQFEPPKAFIDTREMLKRLPVSRRTLYDWERAGKLPVTQIGSKKLYHWNSVEAALLRMQKGTV